jgi:hypothetical protein
MKIEPVDSENNLFAVRDVFPEHIVEKVLSTPWLDLSWRKQEGQESWLRRRINDGDIPWATEWDNHLRSIWTEIAQGVGCDVGDYCGTGWWLDEPGFNCAMHTDGELPGSLHMTWIADSPELGTCFYQYKDPQYVRHHFRAAVNSGYIMINKLDANGARRLQWHAMLNTVPHGTFRLSSYTWLNPK